jgi:deazaflavin-dependent oxidoreductase (nitroreductase family)
LVTTTGARTGKPRTLPLLCIRNKDDPTLFALIASNWGQRHYPAWYYNLKVHPQVTCTLAGQVGRYVAREAVAEEYERFWRYAADTYLGYPMYKQRIGGRRRIPIMVMTPLTS